MPKIAPNFDSWGRYWEFLLPELSVFNVGQTIAFYKKLGFKILYERPEDLFVFMSFEESQFMFEQIHNDGRNIGESSMETEAKKVAVLPNERYNKIDEGFRLLSVSGKAE